MFSFVFWIRKHLINYTWPICFLELFAADNLFLGYQKNLMLHLMKFKIFFLLLVHVFDVLGSEIGIWFRQIQAPSCSLWNWFVKEKFKCKNCSESYRKDW